MRWRWLALPERIGACFGLRVLWTSANARLQLRHERLALSLRTLTKRVAHLWVLCTLVLACSPDRDRSGGQVAREGGQSGTESDGALQCRADRADEVRSLGLDESIEGISCTGRELLALLPAQQSFACSDGTLIRVSSVSGGAAHELQGIAYRGETPGGVCALLSVDVTLSLDGLPGVPGEFVLTSDSSCLPQLVATGSVRRAGADVVVTVFLVVGSTSSTNLVYVFSDDGSDRVFCSAVAP